MTCPSENARLRELDAVCDAFEAALRKGEQPRIEEYLQQHAELDRDELLRELLVIECQYRAAQGDPPVLAELETRFPHHQKTLEMVIEGAEAHAASVSATGRVLHEYELLEKIGQGGMGEVYRARHQRMDRIVAVKLMSERLRDSQEASARFLREVRAAARLIHPHIVAAYDAGSSAGCDYLVLEYVEGVDLQSLLKQTGPLNLAEALCCVQQAAAGLAFAHGEGVIHRDIKPSNLLLDKTGNVKILDMGLARFGDGSSATQTGHLLGTVDFMSPEQAQDVRRVDARSDIYSLGCTLFTLLTGQPLYDGESAMNRILAHREQPVPSLQEARPETPEPIDRLFRRMVAKRPDARPQSIAEWERELTTALAEFGGSIAEEAKSALAARVDRCEWLPRDLPADSTARCSEAEMSTAAVTRQPTPVRARRTALYLALAAFGLFALLAVLVILVQTPRGSIEIHSFDPDLEIAIKRRGEVVDAFTLRQGPRVTQLAVGEYTIEVKGGPRPDVVIRNQRVMLKRGRKEVVEILQIPTAPRWRIAGSWETPDGRLEKFLPNGEVEIFNPGENVAKRKYRFDARRTLLHITEPDGREVHIPTHWISQDWFVQHQPWNKRQVEYKRRLEIRSSSGRKTVIAEFLQQLEQNQHKGIQSISIDVVGGWAFTFAGGLGRLASLNLPSSLSDHVGRLPNEMRVRLIAVASPQSWLVISERGLKTAGKLPPGMLEHVQKLEADGDPVQALDFTASGAWVAVSRRGIRKGGTLDASLQDYLQTCQASGNRIRCVALADNGAWIVITED